MVDLPPEPVRLPSPEELLAEQAELRASAIAKLAKLGLTADEINAITS